jgi:hypothetical protein
VRSQQPAILAEITLQSLMAEQCRSADFLARADILRALGF